MGPIASDVGVAGPATSPAPVTSRGRFGSWAGPLVGIGLALWLVGPVVGARPPAGEDVMAHLVRADFGISELVAHGRLDGWFPRFVLGHQEFLFNGPGLTWLMALLRAATLGALSNTGALKAVCLLSFAAIPPAVSFLARSYRLPARAADLSGLLALCVSSYFGVGLDGLFDVGLIPHQVGAVLFCLALGACLRTLAGDRGRWSAVAAGSLAALTVTHLISLVLFALVLALTLLALAAGRRLPAAGLARLAAGGLGAGGLAGFWIVPLVAHRDLRGVVTTWGTPPLPERLGAILRGEILFPAGFLIVVVAAWAVGARHVRRRPEVLAWVAVPAAYLAVAHTVVRLDDSHEITLQLANRGLGYVGLLSVLAVGALLDGTSRRLGPAGPPLALLATALFVVVAAPGRDVVGQLAEPRVALRDAAAELAHRVPDGARFATQRDFPYEVARTGVIHPEIWLARVSGRNSLNGFNLEASSTPGAGFAAEQLDERSAARTANTMVRYGVSHVVAVTEAFAAELARSRRFAQVWEEPPISIFEVLPRPGQAAPASLLSASIPISGRLVGWEPEHLSLAVSAPKAAPVTVALAWSPKWRGRIDGSPASLDRTSDGLVRVQVPAGDHVIQLDFAAVDGWDRAGRALSALTLAGSAGAALRRHAARQPMSRSFSRTA